MFHLFHLGPLVVGERRLWLLSGVNEEGGYVHPVLDRDLATGLGALVTRHGAQNLRVETALTEVAAPLGVRPEPLPDRALVPRAVLAFAFSSSHRLFRKPSAVASLLEACAFFEKTAPWRRFRSDDAFAVMMTEGWRCWKREFVVRGSGNAPRGLELHEKPGFVAWVPKVDSLLLTFEPGPHWAAEAVRTAYGLGEFPTVIRLKPGSRRGPEALELLQLSAALRSAALLADEPAIPEHGAHVELSADGYELIAMATPPERLSEETASHPEPRTSRNALCRCGSGLKFGRAGQGPAHWLAHLSLSSAVTAAATERRARFLRGDSVDV